MGSAKGNRQTEKKKVSTNPHVPWESNSVEVPSPESPVALAPCLYINLSFLHNVQVHTHTHIHLRSLSHTHKGFELQSARFGPVQTQIKPYSLGYVSGTHQAVCTAISSLVLSMFCPLSFQQDYGMLSSCGNINWVREGSAKDACLTSLLKYTVIIMWV